jgi:hypothetical protein
MLSGPAEVLQDIGSQHQMLLHYGLAVRLSISLGAGPPSSRPQLSLFSFSHFSTTPLATSAACVMLP